MIDDAELLRRYAENRSESAFAELVQRHVNVVYAAALRRVGGDAHLAEEVAQTVFTILARKAGSLARHPVLIGWLHRSTHYAAVDALRDKLRREQREQVVEIVNVNAETNGNRRTDVAWEEVRPVVDSLLDQLNERDRGALLLRFFEGRSFAQIGATLRLSEDAARMRVDRALEKLRAALGRRGITSTTAALGVALANQVGAAAPAGLAASVAGGALAGAAAAGVGGAATFLTFMSTTKVVSGVAGMVTLLAVFSAVREVGRARESAAVAASVGAERDALKARIAALEQRQSTRAGGGPAVTVAGSAGAPSTATAPVGDAAARSAAWQSASPANFALEHPEARPAFVQQEVLRAKARFERFFKSAGISTEQQAEIEKHLKDFAEAMLDYYSSVRAQGFGPMNPPQDPKVLMELLRMESDVVSRFTNDLRGVVGEGRTKQFFDYQKTVPEINVADQLAAQLYATDAPLTAEQALQLVQVLKESRHSKDVMPSPANTMNGTFVSSETVSAALKVSNLVTGSLMMPGRLAWSAPVTDAAIARAQAVLAPTQLAALRQLQAQQVAQYQLAPPSPKGATPEQALELYRKQGGK